MTDFSAPDLTRHPPRSPRVRLGGFVHLPRLLDKTRALLRGNVGDYIYPCPLDQRFFAFTGLDAAEFLQAVERSRGDTEMIAWVREHLTPARTPAEILAWSTWLENTGPGDARRHANFAQEITKLAPGREDVFTTFERLDLDDYVSFGGRA